jgi:hypothetical protein
MCSKFYPGMFRQVVAIFSGVLEARGGAVVEALHTNRKVAASIPDHIIGIFH